MITIDAHCDAPSQMLRLRDYGKDNDFAQVDFPKMRRGGVDASFFAAYVPARLKGKQATDYALTLLDTLEREMGCNEDIAAYARCASGVRRNKAAGKISVIACIENASALDGSLENLKMFYKRGVRYITLVHSEDNDVCDSCTGSGTWGGLSPFGKELVCAMNDKGMMIDVAHASEDSIRDVLETSRLPIAYTHGCCKAIASHRRNLSDELMESISRGGGIVCMSIYPCFLDDGFVHILAESGLEEQMWIEDEFNRNPSDPQKASAWRELQRKLNSLPRPGVGRVADHIEHAVQVAGIEHVGIGTDYDGIEVAPQGMEDISRLGLVFDELGRRGFSRKDISRIAGENLLNVMRIVRKR